MADSGIERHVTKMPALGRTFQLGDLYDYRNDHIVVTGGRQDLESAITFKAKLQIKRPDSVSCNKWEIMGLDEHSQASTVSGLLDKYRGASNYLNDRQYPTQVAKILVCRVKSRTEFLNLSAFINQEIFGEKGHKDATHIVSSVTYGAEAYCVLTQDLVNESDQDARDEAEENLSTIALTMENALGDNQDVTEFRESFDKEKKQLANRLKCRLYADLQSQPVRECSIYDAYKHFLKLVEQIQKTDDGGNNKSIPITIQLCPLKVIAGSLVAGAPPDYRDVDADLTARCCRIWHELESIGARVAAIKKGNRSSLNQFGTVLNKYQDLVRKGLKTAILKAREHSNGDDHEIERLVNIVERHPLFKPPRLMRWVHYKQAEVEMMGTLANSGIFFLASRTQMEKELTDSFDKKYALVLYVPPLDERTNEILATMTDYVNTYKKLVLVDADDDDEEDEEEESGGTPWHMIQRKRKHVLEKMREFADHVKKNEHLETQVQFFVTFAESRRGQGFGCHYSVYEAGKILKDNLIRLPLPPSDLQMNLTDKSKPAKKVSVVLKWNYEHDLGFPCQFLINYRLKDSSDSWNHKTTKPGETQTVMSFQRRSAMEIRVAADTCIGIGEFSEIIDTESALDDDDETELCGQILESRTSSRQIGTESLLAKETIPKKKFETVLQPPTDIKVGLVTQTTAQVGWSQFSADCTNLTFHYCVRYWPNGQDASLASTLVVETPGCHLEKLQPETTYSIEVTTMSNDGQQKSEHSKTVNLTTLDNKIRFAEMLVKRCAKITNRNGMDFYAVPLLKSSSGSSMGIDRFVFGKSNREAGENNGRMQHRTILIMGATGSGKTTLINGMINYIFDVQWDDPFRFQLVQEQIAGRSQIDSQTSRITAYDIHHVEGFRIPYSLTIIDTPGYGDTKGLDRDKEITEMVRQFFEDTKGIQELDMVGFVALASLPRLTPTQMYIFDSVLSIFGNDIKENINFLLTFSDSQVPPVLSAITQAELPCPIDSETRQPVHHKFNNSGFFCANHESRLPSGASSIVNQFNRFFWRMGMENFQRFFNVLATMTTKSLSLTKQVLEERKRLEATVDGLQPLIKVGLAKMEEMRKTKQMISNSQAQIEANENVEFEVEVTLPKKVDIPAGQYLTNCNKCYITCHNPCAIPNDDGKVKCAAMDRSIPKAIRTCRVCPRKCIWNLHANQPYMWEYVSQKQVTSSDEIKRRYEKELKKKLTAEELIKVLQEDVDKNEQAVLERVDTVTRCIRRLDEIALRPNPFSTPQYIDLIINAEKSEKKVGFKERIESLQKLRQMAVITSKITKQENLFTSEY